MHDNLINIRKLPANLLGILEQLIVNRRGEMNDANMLTLDILGYIEPDHAYKLNVNQNNEIRVTLETARARPFLGPNIDTPIPKHAQIIGEWQNAEFIAKNNANILGGMGMLQLNIEAPSIPVIEATAETLAFYNAYLISPHDTFSLETTHFLPLVHVYIGENYVPGYLTQENYGGGDYIEYHDQPHLWVPLSPDSKGHILLGRKYQNQYYLTGFRIPFGSAVYLSPYALHSDAYLVGEYLVVYTVTDNYSTVLFRDARKEFLSLKFV